MHTCLYALDVHEVTNAKDAVALASITRDSITSTSYGELRVEWEAID